MEINCISCDAKVKANFVYGDNVARFCPSCGSSKITVDYTQEEQQYQASQNQVATAPSEPKEKLEAPKTDDSADIGMCQSFDDDTEKHDRAEFRPSFNCGPLEDWMGDSSTGFFRYEVQDAPAQGSDAWLAWRKNGITATEAAAIVFPDQYGSPLKVYTDKLGLTQNDQSDENGFFEWGHIIEDDLVRKFAVAHPEAREITQGRLYQRMWAKCSLDAQCFIGDTPVIIECKTSQSLSKWSPYPDRYFAQVQWQMYVTGIRKAIIVALVSENGWHYIEREVEYSPKFVEEMLWKCYNIHECVLKKTPPATLGDFTPDKKAISALAGDSGHSGENVTTDKATYEKYMELKEKADKATQEFEDFKNSLSYQMIDAPRMTCEGKTFCSWVERKGSTKIDSKKLKELYPEAYEACSSEGLPSRYLKFNKLTFAE